MSGSQFIELFVGGLAIGCIYSLIALGFTMIIRATGVLHFAQGEVVMLGAMFGVTAHHLLPLPFVALLVAGMAVGGLAAVAIELGVYRPLRFRRVPLMTIIIATFSMGFLPAMKAFVAATLGGLGSIGGAMAGGILFGLIETFAAISISTSYKDAVGMILLILILLAWPEGLAGLIRQRR